MSAELVNTWLNQDSALAVRDLICSARPSLFLLPPVFRWVHKSFSGVDPYRRNRRFRNDTTPKRSPNRFGNDLNTQKRKKKWKRNSKKSFCRNLHQENTNRKKITQKIVPTNLYETEYVNCLKETKLFLYKYIPIFYNSTV